MRRMDNDPLACSSVQPAIHDTPTWEHERVDAASIKHGEFEIAVEGRGSDQLPFHD